MAAYNVSIPSLGGVSIVGTSNTPCVIWEPGDAQAAATITAMSNAGNAWTGIAARSPSGFLLLTTGTKPLLVPTNPAVVTLASTLAGSTVLVDTGQGDYYQGSLFSWRIGTVTAGADSVVAGSVIVSKSARAALTADSVSGAVVGTTYYLVSQTAEDGSIWFALSQGSAPSIRAQPLTTVTAIGRGSAFVETVANSSVFAYASF